MALGMSYSDYWDSDPEMVRYYRQASRLKQKEMNFQLWLQGAYIYEALGDIAPILVFGAKSGTRVKPYSKEPYILSEREKEEREQQKAKAELETNKAKFIALAEAFNRKFKEKQKKKMEVKDNAK